MVDLKPNLASYARVSYFRELHGDLAGAAAGDAARGLGRRRRPENLAYVQTLLGDLELDRGTLRAPPSAPTARRWRPTPATRRRRPGSPGSTRPRGDLGAAIERYRRRRRAAAAARVRDRARRGRARRRPRRGRGAPRSRAGRGRGAAAALGRRRRRTSSWRCSRPTTATRAARSTLGRGAWRRAPERALRRRLRVGAAQRRPRRGALAMSREAMRLGSRDPYFLYHAGMIAADAGEPGPAPRSCSAGWSRRARASARSTARAPSGRWRGCDERPARRARRRARRRALAAFGAGARRAPIRSATSPPTSWSRCGSTSARRRGPLRPRPGRDPDLPAGPAPRRRRRRDDRRQPSGRRWIAS